MRIDIDVKGEKYMPGTAHVRINGKLVAKLRGHEGFTVETREEYSNTTRLPPFKTDTLAESSDEGVKMSDEDAQQVEGEDRKDTEDPQPQQPSPETGGEPPATETADEPAPSTPERE